MISRRDCFGRELSNLLAMNGHRDVGSLLPQHFSEVINDIMASVS